ncbi:TetR/AcrR family transcriptional regulator [Gordonia sp. HY285]|uniref:TetR/AcrR family transcriptional regulator n=1 Tax=Gordonia liuliyuniae TaxID=2911517 RepID=A0ABS9IWJ6_9ACTN|nr:TetR/AcrR family transcriptional regulator [Gordonia liuliyuniae]MCF8589934.1 TetR/AcrR family transcriptional regulator [Gordonia liuliyuniae]MCF8612126.1 TetR/AcrR family transcriptional regulator [Gordonia liuliyuniae]
MTIEKATVPPTLFERATQRAISAPPGRSADATREKLLVAAYEQFCIDGVSGASMEDVAKRAGTSRITIYRKFDSKDALVDEVIAHELSEYFAYFQKAMAEADTFAERLVTGFVTSIQQIWSNPLIKRLIADDPALVPGLVGGGGGRNMYAVSQFVATALGREQQAGNLDPSVDPDMAAELIARLTGSFVTTPGGQVRLDDTAQLEQLARSYLLPMLKVPTD